VWHTQSDNEAGSWIELTGWRRKWDAEHICLQTQWMTRLN